jgi:Tfp pilus assembly protein PilO
MNPNEVAKLKKQCWLPIILIALMLALPSYFTEPRVEALQRSEGAVDQSIAKARSLLKESRENLEMAAYLEALGRELESVDKRLPRAEELPDVIDELHAKAGEAGVSIENVVYQFGERYAQLAVSSCQLNMMVQGSYEGMKSFLEKIEAKEKPIIIDEIILASNRLSYTVKVRVITK